MHLYETHAYEMGACQMHAYEMHAYEGFCEDLAGHNTVARRFLATARFRRRHIWVLVIVVAP
jgi:hypothetical protein